MDSLKSEIVIMAGIAFGVIYLANQAKDAASKAASDAADAIAQAASDAWEAARKAGAQVITATNDATFGEGQTINSTIPLYQQKTQPAAKKPANYTPGDINDGAIF